MQEGLRRVAFRKELYADLLRRFAKQQGEMMGEIRQALKKKDGEQARFLVHSLKGMSGNIGAAIALPYIQEMELWLKDGVMDGTVPMEFEKMAACIEEIAQNIDQATFEKEDGKIHAEENADRVQEDEMYRLLRLLQESDMEARICFYGMREALKARMQTSTYAELERAMTQFEFLEAAKILSSAL